MKKLASFSLAVFIGFCLLVATDRKAWGYVDPGTGLLALQSLGAMAATAGYVLRRKIASLFGSKQKTEEKKKPQRAPVLRVGVKPDSSRNAA